jgi:aflatoxin B1 aldehyde reductase
MTVILKELGIRELDTAAVYPIQDSGGSERVIGALGLPGQNFVVDSKVLYFGDGGGTLAPEAVERSVDQSLKSLNIDKVCNTSGL